jgi:hypothetical protein
MATVPNTDSSMRSRTEDCVAMLPTGNRTGSVRMLSLATGRIVTRDKFKILPMPESVISTMNDMALRDGRTLLRKDSRVSHAHLHDAPDRQRANHHPLPNYITVPHHSGMDPSIAISDVLPLPLADSLADESGLLPIEHGAGVCVCVCVCTTTCLPQTATAPTCISAHTPTYDDCTGTPTRRRCSPGERG